MDTLTTLLPFILRGIERIIIDLAGVLSIYLGYRLFSIAMDATGELEASTQQFKLKMQRIAPGTFFALFGAAILIAGLYNSLSLDATGQSPTPSAAIAGPAPFSAKYADSTPPVAEHEQERRALENIGKIFSLTQHYGASWSASPLDQQTFNQSITELMQFREILVDRIFGEGAFQRYLAKASDGSTKNLSALSAPEKSTHEQIAKLMEYSKWPSTPQ